MNGLNAKAMNYIESRINELEKKKGITTNAVSLFALNCRIDELIRIQNEDPRYNN